MNRPRGPHDRSPWTTQDPDRRTAGDGGGDGGERLQRIPRGADGRDPYAARPSGPRRLAPPRDRTPGAGAGEPSQRGPWSGKAPPPRRNAGARVTPHVPAAPGPASVEAPRPTRDELRLYGLNAVDAVFRRRPQAIRKVYLGEARIPALQPLLKWCVANRVGYRVVDEADLQKLAASSHHEGVVVDVLRAAPVPLSTWLQDLPAGPQCALWLDGVGNPHNFGAILRSAAHFGVAAVLLPKDSPLALSGAAARVAEGGAEAVPLVRLGRADNALAQLRGAGFRLAATVVDGGTDPFATSLPERLVYVLGAEGEGMDRELAQACDLRLSIAGSGAVESLNVAAATAVFIAAWARARPR